MQDSPAASTSEAVVPFHFQCQRSGHCCRVPDGLVWLEEGELEPLAAALGLERESFESSFVRTVVDPASGKLRRALRDDGGGRCSLLEGANECRVYGARPEHCRQFPFWKSILPTLFIKSTSPVKRSPGSVNKLIESSVWPGV